MENFNVVASTGQAQVNVVMYKSSWSSNYFKHIVVGEAPEVGYVWYETIYGIQYRHEVVSVETL